MTRQVKPGDWAYIRPTPDTDPDYAESDEFKQEREMWDGFPVEVLNSRGWVKALVPRPDGYNSTEFHWNSQELELIEGF